jgi:glucose-6-phosphate 1-dehydrogenase
MNRRGDVEEDKTVVLGAGVKTAEILAARAADPCAMVIFGASGDLTKRKLVPALHHLAVAGLLPTEFGLVGFARADMNTETFRSQLEDEARKFLGKDFSTEVWAGLKERIHFVHGSFDDPAAYVRLAQQLLAIDRGLGTKGNYLHYLATPPSAFGEVARQLSTAGLTAETEGRYRRVIVEKPFGRDLDSARALNRELQAVLGENQIYRIDHYLGKETVQNILVLRFANGLFEPVWNQRYVDHVQITASETLGVENRAGYYEESGALRDMVSNHLFQLLALIAMEPPAALDADAVRDEKAKVLRAIRPYSPEEVLERTVRGQYAAGTIDERAVPAYRNEPGVALRSTTDTFAALRVTIDNWRWAGVPFYVRTGKRLAKRLTEVVIRFKSVPHVLFRGAQFDRLIPNELTLRIQPDEGISLRFGAKVPGPVLKLGDVNMDFGYGDYFSAAPSTGYETLLYDCMKGDPTLFQRADNVEASWSALGPVLDVWKALAPRDFPNYAAGTWGPAASDALIAKDGHAWRNR